MGHSARGSVSARVVNVRIDYTSRTRRNRPRDGSTDITARTTATLEENRLNLNFTRRIEMSDKKEKPKKVNVKRYVAILRDDLTFLKKRLELLFNTCDEGLVHSYTKEKEPRRLLEQSLEQVAHFKVCATKTIESFRPKIDG
jgi:hypothetical protein